MGDWAGFAASAALEQCNLLSYTDDDVAVIANRIRQARLDALEEAALACEVRWLQKGQGIGKDYAATIRALKESEPECG